MADRDAAPQPGADGPVAGRKSSPRWRGFGRLLGDGEADERVTKSDADADLQLELTLLREENARLKSERHRRLDVGTLIDKMRLVASDEASDDTLADARAVLAECIVIREELEESCDELQAAIATLREQLAGLGVGIAVPAPGGG